ncbi:sigma factor-like helix-turn-helix DNA-binding protein [Clostridium lundense]|uniref:sigma factor-like helix-turn-helix DNA-binding protein n=1 Tax=Clostridium lundense TaxID=319475 RepID=UPI000483572A|nr:sigma factor-like helix-turn-helix DNA-binding protein [Clostridium lundense]
MTRDELIIKTENYIKNIPKVKKEISKLDEEIIRCNEKTKEPTEEVKILSRRRRLLEIKIEKLKNAMDVLSEQEQKIICYRYFENMSCSKIGSVMGYSQSFCKKSKVNNILYRTGQMVFAAEILLCELGD